jgi:hypothetical protein
MPTPSRMQSQPAVPPESPQQAQTASIPMLASGQITILPPTSDEDRAAFITVIATILARIARESAAAAESGSERTA